MKKNRKTINAIEILNDRYIKDDPDRRASLEVERVNAEVAQTIYDENDEDENGILVPSASGQPRG